MSIQRIYKKTNEGLAWLAKRKKLAYKAIILVVRGAYVKGQGTRFNQIQGFNVLYKEQQTEIYFDIPWRKASTVPTF